MSSTEAAQFATPSPLPEFDPATVKLAVESIKFLAVDAVQKANSGHPGAPMGLANIAFEVFASALRHDPSAPDWRARDRFVLSCGHASMLLYALLHLSGYAIKIEDLQAFRQWDSITPGHPEAHHTPGVETTTGPLGQGIANGVGFALAQQMLQARYGDLFAARTYVLASDGDMMEGVAHEASSLAGHLGLANLIVFYDDNKITIDGGTDIAFTEDVGARYAAMGWAVQHIDGHDHAQIRAAIVAAQAERARPSLIVARTQIGHGAPNKAGSPKVHGAPLGDEEIALAKQAAGWDPEKRFFVPEAVRMLFAERAQAGAAAHRAWQQRMAQLATQQPALAQAIEAQFAQELPSDLFAQLLAAAPSKPEATRSVSGAVMQKAAEIAPWLVGGAADLVESTKTEVKGSAALSRADFSGRNLHFGIREHGMGAICNALALSSAFVPFGSTFLIFSDYMRPAIRLSALMQLPCLWLFTHDSVLLGEDGPTHQPVEQLASLRLIPNTWVMRPADGVETAACWTLALQRKNGPSVFALSRQKLATLPRQQVAPEQALRGAYVLQEASEPQAVLIASGSEVGLALSAAELLAAQGTQVRVVSAPCWEAFCAQDASYREAVLPRALPRVAIELGVSAGWQGIVGLDGLVIGLDRFGASAPEAVLATQFGFTAEAVAAKVSGWLAARG